MVTITASITADEIATKLGVPKVVAKTIIQRMFNMNFFRNFPDKFSFFFQPWNVVGKRTIYGSSEEILIGLSNGETDGSKDALMAYIEKAAPSHVDLTAWPKKVTTEPPVEPEEPVDPPEETEEE